MTTTERQQVINHNPALQSYYTSLESRIGYKLVLGGTRHFGYYDNGSSFFLPIGRALRRMEAKLLEQVNAYAAMPTNTRSTPGLYKEWLENAGFENVEVKDYSENIKPMLRLFWLLACVPYFFIKLLHLEEHFINTVAGYQGYRGHQFWRYVAISATKPGGPIEKPKTK
ncbi:hypothetical protein QBC46DRAFT_352306 [Diplogelasinospora grovesii]|uniref:Uncharacterized protein n=1 Tax=Diplogelasinospora grovesii TaxID=303347 RepID=A0AAN6NB89_9PEZI|nr:hypothetical protein QBC46DRAFT_352306 [Diplogelasinospora grovesii]